jgi:hypothetical protein
LGKKGEPIQIVTLCSAEDAEISKTGKGLTYAAWAVTMFRSQTRFSPEKTDVNAAARF